MQNYKVAIAYTIRRKGFLYFAASLYKLHTTKDGRLIWRFAGIRKPHRRGYKIAQKEAQELATEYNCEISKLYGGIRGIHNMPPVFYQINYRDKTHSLKEARAKYVASKDCWGAGKIQRLIV